MTAGRGAPQSWRGSGPKLWRIRGRAPDGLLVTLGRYETEPEAQSDLQRFTRERAYRDVELTAIESPEAPPAEPPPA